eukprot:3621580-Prymnesium_polylepis.2
MPTPFWPPQLTWLPAPPLRLCRRCRRLLPGSLLWRAVRVALDASAAPNADPPTAPCCRAAGRAAEARLSARLPRLLSAPPHSTRTATLPRAGPPPAGGGRDTRSEIPAQARDGEDGRLAGGRASADSAEGAAWAGAGSEQQRRVAGSALTLGQRSQQSRSPPSLQWWHSPILPSAPMP